ncbi:MAG: hypothetical protein HN417_10900 [Desulfobacula sp.]|nr:hypothetical protein [Desulfobacula sp.]
MQISLTYGWIEWLRSFSWAKIGIGYRRDFFWLTILMLLTFTLMLLLWSSHEGVANKFMDVSIGFVPGKGVPVWVKSERSQLGGRFLMDNEVIDKIRQIDTGSAEIFPYSDVDHSYARLPAYSPSYEKLDKMQKAVWMDEKNPDKNAEIRIRAVYLDDPLWTGQANEKLNKESNESNNKKPASLPLELVIDESLFNKHFNCEAYLNALRSRLPKAIIMAAYEPASEKSCLDYLGKEGNRRLWLDIKTKNGRELVEFRVRTVPRIHTMERVAILFPMSTFHALNLADLNPNLIYFPEGEGREVNRVKKLKFWQSLNKKSDNKSDKKFEQEQIKAFADCLECREPKGKRLEIEFYSATPENIIKACAKEHNIIIEGNDDTNDMLEMPYVSITDEIRGTRIQSDDKGNILVPFDVLNPSLQKEYANNKANDKTNIVKVNMVKELRGYADALVYVKDRTALFKTINAIKKIKTEKGESALNIPQIYQDSVARIGFINKVLGMLKLPYMLFFFLFFLVLLTTQLGFVVDHRKHNYGVFLSKGFSVSSIYYMVLFQMLLCFAPAFLSASVILLTMRFCFSLRLNNILDSVNYRDHINVGDLELLPISLQDYLCIAFVCVLTILFITSLRLRFLGLKAHTEPSSLLHS